MRGEAGVRAPGGCPPPLIEGWRMRPWEDAAVAPSLHDAAEACTACQVGASCCAGADRACCSCHQKLAPAPPGGTGMAPASAAHMLCAFRSLTALPGSCGAWPAARKPAIGGREPQRASGRPIAELEFATNQNRPSHCPGVEFSALPLFLPSSTPPHALPLRVLRCRPPGACLMTATFFGEPRGTRSPKVPPPADPAPS